MSNEYPNTITFDNVEIAKKYFTMPLMPLLLDISPKSVSVEITYTSGFCSLSNCGLTGISNPKHRISSVTLYVEEQTEKLLKLHKDVTKLIINTLPLKMVIAKKPERMSSITFSPKINRDQELQFLVDNYDFIMNYLAGRWTGICWFSDSTPEGDPLNNERTKDSILCYSSYRLAKWIRDKTPEFGIIHASAPVVNPIHANPNDRLSVIQSYTWVTSQAMRFAFKDPNRKLGGWNKYLGDIPSYLREHSLDTYDKKLENIFKNIIK